MVGKMTSVLCIVEMLTARSVRSIFRFSQKKVLRLT